MKSARKFSRRGLPLVALLLAATEVAAQMPVQSFADLQPLVRTGQQVVVQSDDGRKTTGRIVSLTGNQLEIQQRRWFRIQAERLSFAEGSVSRIESHDSDWNGSLIGGGVGVLTTVLLLDRCGENADVCDYATILSPVAGLLAGRSSINRSSARSTSRQERRE